MKAALSLDLDNQWSYMKTHGDPAWQALPSYLDTVVPRALEALDRIDARVTFFIVGLDASLPANGPALRSIAQAGHEIGNHSFHHEPWMHRRTPGQIREEISAAGESIHAATGQRPRGFRGPGFVRSPEIYRALAGGGYAYDASTLPTFIGPLARAYYFRSAKLDAAARRERADLFGGFSDGFASNRPHTIATAEGPLLEIPVTTMPGLRLPIHLSYLLYIAGVSERLALAYFVTALNLCKMGGIAPSILLHPLDFLDASDCPDLRFFPAMGMPAATKGHFVERALRLMGDRFAIGPLVELVPQTKVPQAAYSANE